MNNGYLKSILYGSILGAILFAIAPLGLGVPFVEVLKPILAPGALVVRLFVPNNAGITPMLLALLSNAAIFSLLFIACFAIRKNSD